MSTISKEKSIKFILNAITCFNKLREVSIVIAEDHMKRLTEDILVTDNMSGVGSSLKQKIFKTINAYFRKYVSLFITVIYVLFRIPVYIKQFKKVKSLSKNKSLMPYYIFSIASRRLGNISGDCVRDYLKKIISPLKNVEGGINNIKGFRHFSEEDIIFIQDPSYNSCYWSNIHNCWKEHVFILDNIFILFTFVMGVLSRPRLLISLFNEFRMWGNIEKLGFFQIFQSFIYVKSFDSLMPDNNITIGSTFLTSNSLSTELLRFYLLQKQTCNQVCEIEHGIPTIFWKKYIFKLLEFGAAFNSDKKYSSIPQLPNLPMSGDLYKDIKCNNDVAINTYLNKFFIDILGGHNSVEEYVKNEFDLFFSKAYYSDDNENSILISFIGSASPKKEHFFDSDYFKLEINIIGRIRRGIESLGRKYIIIYTPHPLNNVSDFLTHPEFVKPDILVYNNTVISWFLADWGVSFNSSALYEASFFGVRSFLFVEEIDKIFDKFMLEFVTSSYSITQVRETKIIKNLEQFIKLSCKHPVDSISERIGNRLSKISVLYSDMCY